MKKIYLTFDIETIVSGISKNEDYLLGVYLSSMFMAEELRKRELKATFFISISSKQKNINQDEYTEFVKWLIFSLKPYDNIKIEPHVHAYNLPLSFECKYDEFDKYDYAEQVELLTYAKNFFKQEGVETISFRPGGFSSNKSYYQALKEAGYQNSSILERNKEANIDLIAGKTVESGIYTTGNGVVEYPVTSVRIKSIKGKEEIINLSPDFLTLASVEKHIRELNYVNINFHSFSIYLNRLVRENHKGLVWENIKFLMFENILKNILKLTNIRTYNKSTVMSNELMNWLDFVEDNKYNTYFIGE